jgi:hypothetical protein
MKLTALPERPESVGSRDVRTESPLYKDPEKWVEDRLRDDSDGEDDGEKYQVREMAAKFYLPRDPVELSNRAPPPNLRYLVIGVFCTVVRGVLC